MTEPGKTNLPRTDDLWVRMAAAVEQVDDVASEALRQRDRAYKDGSIDGYNEAVHAIIEFLREWGDDDRADHIERTFPLHPIEAH